MRSKKYLKVPFDGLKESGLIDLENEDMGIFDVALLVECEQLVDIDSGKRYCVTINADSLIPLRLVPLLSEYPKLQSTIVSHIEDLELAEAEDADGEDWDEEREFEQPEVDYHDDTYYEEGLDDEQEYTEPDSNGE